MLKKREIINDQSYISRYKNKITLKQFQNLGYNRRIKVKGYGLKSLTGSEKETFIQHIKDNGYSKSSYDQLPENLKAKYKFSGFRSFGAKLMNKKNR